MHFRFISETTSSAGIAGSTDVRRSRLGWVCPKITFSQEVIHVEMSRHFASPRANSAMLLTINISRTRPSGA
jgi:hypothetical protein